MATGGDQGEISGHRDVGQSGDCNIGSILGGIHPGGIDVDNDGSYTKYWWRVQRNRSG